MENELNHSRDRKQDIAYNYLKKMIIENELKPGTYVNENDIVNQLSISKTPVREAIQRLVSERLMNNIPGKGTYVSRILIEDIISIYDLRAAIDALAVKQCIYNSNDQILNELKSALDGQKEALKEKNLQERFIYAMNFINAYIKASNNDWLIDFAMRSQVQMDRIAKHFYRQPYMGDVFNRVEKSIYFDEELYQAILDKNVEKAEQNVKDKWMYFKNLYFDIFKQMNNMQ